MTFDELTKKLKEATLDARAAIEVASEIAIAHLGKAHEKEDDLRVEVAKEKIRIRDENPKMSMAEVEVRMEATDLFREYLRAKHNTERLEEFIRLAKKHAEVANGFN